MDFVYLALALIAALLLPRPRALLATVVAWALCVSFVGWGPAHNNNVHTSSASFWIPWTIVGVVGLGLVMLVRYLRERRSARA